VKKKTFSSKRNAQAIVMVSQCACSLQEQLTSSFFLRRFKRPKQSQINPMVFQNTAEPHFANTTKRTKNLALRPYWYLYVVIPQKCLSKVSSHQSQNIKKAFDKDWDLACHCSL